MRLLLQLLIILSIPMLVACQPDPETSSTSVKVERVDQVYPFLDAANSRWFFFSSACRPFGMVNLSPDNQMGGAWGSGYRYNTDTIKGLSHIHAWQLAGVSVLPVSLESGNEAERMNDYYSSFQHEKEKASPGHHQFELDRYNIGVELTSTTRVGMHRYAFNGQQENGIVFNLGGLQGPCEIKEGKLNKIDSKTLSGSLVNAPTRRRPRNSTVFFYVKLDNEVAEISEGDEGKFLVKLADSGSEPVIMKVAISYTSIENAKANMEAELPGWDFKKIVADSRKEWNSMLGRIEIEGGDEQAQRRFYTDLWHGLQGRRIISDANGSYPDNTGETFRIGQLPLDATGKPKFNHYNSDSFWGAQWTINTLWGISYPDIYEEFVNSLMVYYKDGGFVPRGPSGGNYTHVMTGASSTPFIVSAYQKGIKGFDAEDAYEGMKKNHMPGGTMGKAGYEHDTNIGGGLENYISKGYVPHPNPNGKFGFHQDGASLTMEYAYQDWTLAQMAKALGKTEDADYFQQRAKNYQNTFNPQSTWMHPRDVNGNWMEDFDPYNYENGFNESNGAQSTWFVGHDLTGLADLMGGKEAAIKKLNEQFEVAEKQGFTATKSHDTELTKELRRIPINYGNQPSMQTAYIFQALGRPDLTQYWSRKVIDAVYSGLNPETGYNGDEDQGLMGSLAVILKSGLFQLNGGTDEDPDYQVGSPVFDRITFHLNSTYYSGKDFVIETTNNNSKNVYVQKAQLNGQPLKEMTVSHSDIVNGGKLQLEMGAKAVK